MGDRIPAPRSGWDGTDGVRCPVTPVTSKTDNGVNNVDKTDLPNPEITWFDLRPVCYPHVIGTYPLREQ